MGNLMLSQAIPIEVANPVNPKAVRLCFVFVCCLPCNNDNLYNCNVSNTKTILYI